MPPHPLLARSRLPGFGIIAVVGYGAVPFAGSVARLQRNVRCSAGPGQAFASKTWEGALLRLPPDVLASVLTCCDMTISPDGQPVPVERRLAEIHDRYGSRHLVSRSIQRATPMILCAVEQVHQRATQTT